MEVDGTRLVVWGRPAGTAKMDMKSLGLPQEDVLVGNKWGRKIRGISNWLTQDQLEKWPYNACVRTCVCVCVCVSRNSSGLPQCSRTHSTVCSSAEVTQCCCWRVAEERRQPKSVSEHVTYTHYTLLNTLTSLELWRWWNWLNTGHRLKVNTFGTLSKILCGKI